AVFLLEFAFGMGIAEVGPRPGRQLPFAIANDLVLVSDASDSAEEHRQDDEDRPEEDELTAGERGVCPDGEGEAGRAGDHAENGAAHTVPVVLARGGVDLLR